jgi:ribosomal protein S27AE
MMHKPSLDEKPKFRRLFVDIETSPNVVLSWRVGYDLKIEHDNILKERKIIMIGYKFEDEPTAHVLTWDEDQDDAYMLAEFSVIAQRADEIVGHFLDRFDLPWIRTRCLYHGFDPLPPYKTVDTKAWASKYFYFNSNKLDYIASFLGFGNKIKTDFDLWKRIVLYKSWRALREMVRYCRKDVLLLERVFHKLQGCSKSKTHVGVYEGGERWSCGHCGSTHVHKSKTRVTSCGMVQHQMICDDCYKYTTINGKAYEGYLKSHDKG